MRNYFDYTRRPWFSYLAVLPLLVLYQALLFIANLNQPRTLMNGADALLAGLLAMVGLHGWMAWLLVTVAVGIYLYRRDGRRQGMPPSRYFAAVLLESSVYAALLGTVVSVVTASIFPFIAHLAVGGGVTWLQELAVRVGAGLYEELVFRLLLTGGLIALFTHLKWKPGVALASAVLIASLLFSLFHHMPGGEPFAAAPFLFRFVAGLFLSGLYAARGFAVVAWTHSLYDIFLLILAPDR